MAYRVSHCKSCDAEIVWAETTNGSKMPVDYPPSPYGNVVLYESVSGKDGRFRTYATVLGTGEEKPPDVRQSHFTTCPFADQHRKREESPKKGTSMKEEYIAERGGQRYVKFNGLLLEAHERKLEGIDTEMLQEPNKENGKQAIFKATVIVDGKTFTGHGDADPTNVGAPIKPHIVRMAETRSLVRAFRFALGIDMTAIEELLEGAPAEEEDDVDFGPQDVPETGVDDEPDDGGDDHDAVISDIENLIASAPASKKQQLEKQYDTIIEYANKGYREALASRQRVNNIIAGSNARR